MTLPNLSEADTAAARQFQILAHPLFRFRATALNPRSLPG
jgi:hypothetical protein